MALTYITPPYHGESGSVWYVLVYPDGGSPEVWTEQTSHRSRAEAEAAAANIGGVK